MKEYAPVLIVIIISKSMTDYILQNYFIHNNNVVHVHLLQVDCDFEHDE